MTESILDKKLQIANQALILLGTTPIVSLQDPTAESIIVNSLFDSLYHSWLTVGRFNFSKKSVVNLQSTSNAGGSYIFDLPVDFLKIANISPAIEYNIFDNKLHCKTSKPNIVYYRYMALEKIPNYAIGCLVYYLASGFCMALTNSPSRTNSLYNWSLKLIKEIKNNNKQKQIILTSLNQARF